MVAESGGEVNAIYISMSETEVHFKLAWGRIKLPVSIGCRINVQKMR